MLSTFKKIHYKYKSKKSKLRWCYPLLQLFFSTMESDGKVAPALSSLLSVNQVLFFFTFFEKNPLILLCVYSWTIVFHPV